MKKFDMNSIFVGHHLCPACGKPADVHREAVGGAWFFLNCNYCHFQSENYRTEADLWNGIEGIHKQEGNALVGGTKHDDSKARFDLIPPIPLIQLAKVYTYGDTIYNKGGKDNRNWEKGLHYGRIFAAIMRHLWAWWNGEKLDKESGLSHLSHAAWGCFALAHYEENEYSQWDDRPNGPGNVVV